MRRPSSSLNEILPNLNTPFTSLEEAEQQRGSHQSSGAGPMGPFGSLGSQRSRSGFSGVHGSNSQQTSGVFDSDSQVTGSVGLSSSRTLGRRPLGQTAYPQATFPYPNESGGSPFGGQQMSGTPYMPQPSTPMSPMDAMATMAPMGGYGAAMTAEAPAQTQPADLRATLPGSRMTEPPARNETPRERRSWLWLVIALLLIIMIIAVIVLLRGLESPAPSGALGPLFPL